MTPLQLLEAGRSLVERIPYSAVALVSRFALASVFWRSAQTKVTGFSIREETFFLSRSISRHHRRARVFRVAAHRTGVAPFGAGPVRDDHGDPVVRVSRRLAGTHYVGRTAAPDHLARTRRGFARPSDLDTPTGEARCGRLTFDRSCGNGRARPAICVGRSLPCASFRPPENRWRL